MIRANIGNIVIIQDWHEDFGDDSLDIPKEVVIVVGLNHAAHDFSLEGLFM